MNARCTAKRNSSVAKMTKAQRSRMAKLERWVSAAMDLVYLAAPDQHTPFSECYRLASADVRKGYDDAKAALAAFEQQMADEQRGWYDNGRFKDYGDPYGLRRYGSAE